MPFLWFSEDLLLHDAYVRRVGFQALWGTRSSGVLERAHPELPSPTLCSVTLNRRLETSWSTYTTKPTHSPNQDFCPLTPQSQLLNISQDTTGFLHVSPHFLSTLPLNVNDLLMRKAKQNQQVTGPDSKTCSPVPMVPNQVPLPWHAHSPPSTSSPPS